MFAKALRIAPLALFVVLAAACNKEPTAGQAVAPAAKSGSSPEAAVQTSIALLKSGDVGGLIAHSLPPEDYARVKADWGKDQEAPTDEERAHFSEMMAKLTAADAEQALYAEIEPQLAAFDAQYQQQIPMYVNMGRGFLRSTVQQSKDLADAEKEQALAAIDALADWMQGTRFTDPDKVKQVLAIASATAREMKLSTLDEARALGYDEAMQKGQLVFQAVKQAFAVYGFSIDQTLDSAKTTVVSSDGTTAKVKIDYTLLGKPLSADAEMVRRGDNWYGKNALEKLEQHAAEAAAAPASEG